MSQNFPNVGELVIGTCSKVTDHGAYFEIFDYESLGSEAGFVHVSELSRTWVRNIRSHIREGQRSVAKILRVDMSRGEIDMSIRRVSEPQRRQKLTEFKQENRARGIVTVACEKSKKQPADIEKILLTKFGSIYEGLIEVREEETPGMLTKLKIPKDIAKELHQLAIIELEPPMVELHGIMTVISYESDGAKIIQKFFKKIESDFKTAHKDSKVTIQIISAPDYRFTIESKNWKIAENLWKEIQEKAAKYFKKTDHQFSFERK